MNLIYLRHGSPKARKFLKKKLKVRDGSSIYGIEAGDCCLAPAGPARGDYMITFLNGVSPEMLQFIHVSGGRAALARN